MSSTNRGGLRRKSDYYITPLAVVKDFIEVFIQYEPEILNCNNILDPCAGGHEKAVMSYPYILKDYFKQANITTIDIRENSKAEIKLDYFKYNTDIKYDLIITNPPFEGSEWIINKSFKYLNEGGFIVMLLRLNYFGGKNRKNFWNNRMPKYAFVHSERISFNIFNTTDSIEYMHCVWQQGLNQNYTKLYVI